MGSQSVTTKRSAIDGRTYPILLSTMATNNQANNVLQIPLNYDITEMS